MPPRSQKSANSNSQHWSSEILKDKFAKTAAKILIALIIILFLYLVGRALLGYHIKIFGIEVNIPEEREIKTTAHSDTAHFSPSKLDTNLKSEIAQTPIVKKQNSFQGIKVEKRVINDSSKSKYDLRNATFNAPTQVGDNNVQNIDTEIRFGKEELNYFFNIVTEIQEKFGLRKDHVVMFLSNNGGNATIYGQIRTFLAGKNITTDNGTFWPKKHVDVISIFINSKEDSTLGIIVGDIKTLPIGIETP